MIHPGWGKLEKISGIYALVCKIDGKRYIGSAINLYDRLTEHLKGDKSNSRLQRAIQKHGIHNFLFMSIARMNYLL
jgi:group I intron endonuclease